MPQLGDSVRVVSRDIYGTLVMQGTEPGTWWVRRRLGFFSTHTFLAYEDDFGPITVRMERAKDISDEEVNRRLAHAYNYILSLVPPDEDEARISDD